MCAASACFGRSRSPAVAIAVHDGTAIRVRDIASVQVGYQPRLGACLRRRSDTDVVAATILLRKGEQAQTVLEQVHARIEDLNAAHACRAA